MLFSEGGAVGQSMEERRMTVAELKAVFRATAFPFHVVPLEQVCACDSFYIFTTALTRVLLAYILYYSYLVYYVLNLVNFPQVLDLPSEVIMTVPPSSERPASAYKAAVDEFLQEKSSNSFVTEQEEKEPSFPDVPESTTRLLQQLMSSAKTLTARQDLLNNLR